MTKKQMNKHPVLSITEFCPVCGAFTLTKNDSD